MTQTISIINTKALYEYIQKQYENRRLIQYIEIGTTFFISSFFLFFAIRPTAFVISALIGEIKSKETLSVQMKAKIDNVISAQDAFSQIQQNYSLVEAGLPSRPNYSSISDYLNGSIQQSQLQPDTISFNLKPDVTKKPAQKELASYSLSTSINGDYPSIMALIDKLLHGRRVIDIKSVNLANHKSTNSQQQVQPSGVIDVGINPVIYYWQAKTSE